MNRMRTLPLVLVLPSCGTILNGPPYLVDVQSSPPAASVFYKDRFIGRTPCAVPMDGWSMELRLTAPGCQDTVHEVDSHMNWIGSIGNGLLLIPGLVIGTTVDISTGAFRVPDEDSVFVNLLGGHQPPFEPHQSAGANGARVRLSVREDQFAAFASRAGSASIGDTSSYKAQGAARMMRARVTPLSEAREQLELLMREGGTQQWTDQCQKLLTWMKAVEEVAQKLLQEVGRGDFVEACATAHDVDKVASQRPYVDR